MDAATGKTKWKWNEVPVGLWGHKDVNSGGGQWEPPTFDAQGHLYLEVANPAPWVGDKGYPGKKVYANGSSRPGPNLYTDTVDELDPATGKLIWHYQLTPHDIHDWDLNNQALITTVNGKETIISAGKAGIVIANDAQTGKLLWKTPIGKHNGHDNDGINALEGKKIQNPPYENLPGSLGGVETPYASDGTTAYFADNNYPNSPINQAAGKAVPFTSAKGSLIAIDQATGKIKWQHNFPSSPYGSATVSNDLVWTDTFDGTLWALNKSTGAVVWKTKLPAGTNSGLAIDGDSVLVGSGFPLSKKQTTTFVAYSLSGHQRRRRDAGLWQHAVEGSDHIGRRVRLVGGRYQEEQGRRRPQQHAVTAATHTFGAGMLAPNAVAAHSIPGGYSPSTLITRRLGRPPSNSQ